jgi:hypothetical protein
MSRACVMAATSLVDANAGLLQEYDVKSLPTLLVYRSGLRVEQLVGKVPYAIMQRAVQGAA